MYADRTRPKHIDPAYAWKQWKDISLAIALRPLDDPGDILEKAEIIEDRLDDLKREKERLKTISEGWDQRHQSLELQLEVLDDLARIQRGGDLHLQLRMHDLREELGKANRRVQVLKGALEELGKELKSMTRLAVDYREQANALRRREEEGR